MDKPSLKQQQDSTCFVDPSLRPSSEGPSRRRIIFGGALLFVGSVAIFFGGSDLYGCTGAVLHSIGGDLVLTAAHCLGPDVAAAFVPGFARQAAPADFWTVDVVVSGSALGSR